jgi:hypothetical protein
MQPLEASLIGSLVGIIQDCQDRVFGAYREAQRVDDEIEIPPSEDNAALAQLDPAEDGMLRQSLNSYSLHSEFLDMVFEPPRTQVPETMVPIFQKKPPLSNSPGPSVANDTIFLDSGYSNERLECCHCNGHCSCMGAIGNQSPVLDANNLSVLDEFGTGDMQYQSTLALDEFTGREPRLVVEWLKGSLNNHSEIRLKGAWYVSLG